MALDTQSSSYRAPSRPPEAWGPFLRLANAAGRPLERFLRVEAASGILLLIAAAVALACASSPWADAYAAFWHTELGIRVGDFQFVRSLEWVVNDGLMVIFFFVVGLEIRRELHQGELSEWRRAALPAAAAIGGMIAPALLYLSVASVPETHSGWGVPMATDIAFAVGILALLGKRVPAAMRVLLLALAVIDDLGAILVIAIFYASGVAWAGLAFALLGIGVTIALQRFGVRAKLAYVPPALVVWAGVYSAGIHPTIAGVIVGLLTPVRAWIGPVGLADELQSELKTLQSVDLEQLPPHELAGTLRQLDFARREALSPVESLIERLHPWVAYGIMPVFALANAGVSLGGVSWDGASQRAFSGIILGLLLGKPLGVLLFTWLTTKSRITVLPIGIGLRHLVVLGTVAGVGFTMALFVAQLAFSDPRLLAAAKLGVLVGSGVAAVLSLVLGRMLLSSEKVPAEAAQSADEAECSTVA